MLRRLLPVLLGLLLVAPVCFHIVTDTDTGWHLAVGRLVATKGIPHTNALTWTATNEPWYATSWLYDWLAFRAMDGFGVTGLQSLTFVFLALTLLVLALAGARLNRQQGVWVVPLVGLMLLPRISERPHLASWLVLGLVLWLCVPPEDSAGDFRECARREEGWQRRLACIPLIALFSNLHSGAAFPAVVLAFFCAEAFVGGGRLWLEVLIAVGGFVALLANPGGLFNLEYLQLHASLRNVVDIVEMGRPHPSTSPVFFIALPIGLYAGWRERRRSPALLATVVLFGLLGFKAVRFVYEAEIVSALAVVHAARRSPRWAIGVPVAAALVLLAFRIPFYGALRIGHDFDAQQLPVRAAQFIRAQEISGPMYNALRDGGYLEWSTPQLQWFQDARLQAFPASFFIQEQEAEKSAETLRSWVRAQGAEWAIASRQPERMAGYTQFEAPDWALVYWDETSEIRLRRDVPRFAPLIAQYEYKRFRPNAPVNVATAPRAELVEWDRELSRFEETAPAFPMAFVLHCAVRSRLGEGAAAVCAHAEQLANTDQLKQAVARVRELRPAP